MTPFVSSWIITVVQLPSHVRLFTTPWTAAHQASLSLTISQSMPKFMSIESVMPYSHLILCCPLPLLPSVFPSIRVFSNESALCIRWPKYWSFSFSIRWIFTVDSFRIDWFDLLVVQETLKRLFQHHSSKASILWRLAFFIVCKLEYHFWSTVDFLLTKCNSAFVYQISSLHLDDSRYNFKNNYIYIYIYTHTHTHTLPWWLRQ